MRQLDRANLHPSALANRQSNFGVALLNADAPVPEGIEGPNGRSSAHRFNIYRNNVITGQISTLRDAYPATERLVGEEFFTAMAHAYVVGHAPTTPLMFDYGKDFAEFIDAFAPAEELPYLGDVARIERGWVEAYHAADELPMSQEALRDAIAGEPHCVRLLLHPSVRVISSPYPALSIWEINTESSSRRVVSVDDGSEEVLIVRALLDVEVYRLPKGATDCFKALQAGRSLIEAIGAALEREPDFNLVASLEILFSSQAVTHVEPIQNGFDQQDAN